MTEISRGGWEDILELFPDAHILQSAAWGELKSQFGWTSSYLWADGGNGNGIGAQILFRRLPFGKTIAYLPKGPVYKAPDPSVWRLFLASLDQLCFKQKAIFLIVEPDLWEDEASAWNKNLWPQSSPEILTERSDWPLPPGFQTGFQTIQPPRTIVIDLIDGADGVLHRMKQKTRYNIRLASKKGVVVKPSNDVETFHRLIQKTGERDAFSVHSLEYYRKVHELFHPKGECQMLFAEHDGQILGAIMALKRGMRAWYFYGGSVDESRELMPNYLLQWEGIQWAITSGCEKYDLWGVPDASEAELEANFTGRSDGLWGVYRFKRGFGGILSRSAGPWNRVYQPVYYSLYRWWYSRGARGME